MKMIRTTALWIVSIAAPFALIPCGTCHAALMAGDSVSENFNSNVNNWTIARDPNTTVTFVQDPAQGVGAVPSGGAVFTNHSAGEAASAIYTPAGVLADGKIDFNVGDTIELSVSYQVLNDSGNGSASTPRIGIVADDAFFSLSDSLAIGGGGTDHNNIIGFTRTSGPAQFASIRSAADGVGTDKRDSDSQADFNAGEWFRFNLSITKSGVADQFVVSNSIDKLNADGTAVDTANYVAVSTGATPYTNASLYAAADVYAGIYASVNNGLLSNSLEFDDFSMSITAIPEPTSLVLLSLCGLVVVGARFHRTSS